MRLQSQVSSLELSKKLKELGVKQDSLFYWMPRGDKDKWNVEKSGWDNKPEGIYDISAFTVAELGEILSFFDEEKTDEHGFDEFQMSQFVSEDQTVSSGDANEANARAKLLIHLIENDLIN